MVRSTTYGGKAGIFVKRRKPKLLLSIQVPSNDGPSSTRRITPSPTMTIAWDHVKCRPIYLDETAHTMITSSENDTGNEHEDSEPEEEDANNSPAPVPRLLMTSAATFIGDCKKRKARAYGYNQRPCVKMEPTRTSESVSASGPCTRHTNAQQSQEANTLPPVHLSSPVPSILHASICDALNSVSKPTSPARRASHHDHDEDNATDASVEPTDHKPIIAKRIPQDKKLKRHTTTTIKRTQLNFNNHDSTSSSTSTTTATATHQPTCTTSVDRARAFFDQLDQNHPLLVAPGATPIAPSRGVGRTQRTINVDDCRADYDHYVQALTDISTPLPLEQFALHRASYFATEKLCFDGFLDGP